MKEKVKNNIFLPTVFRFSEAKLSPAWATETSYSHEKS